MKYTKIYIQIKYMSIIGNFHEYMLGVAQRIIVNCSDQKTITKYFKLKQQICPQRYPTTQTSFFTLGSADKENSKTLGSLRNTIDMAASKQRKRQNSRDITRKSSSKKEWKTLSRARIQTFDSATHNLRVEEIVKKQMNILSQIATILKNAENCPKMLKKIKLCTQQLNPNMTAVLIDIENSLSTIYEALTAPIAQSQLQCEATQCFNYEEVINDNKWLLQKMQALIKENGVLRRMVGQK